MLIVSNVFMTYAWYGHLKDIKHKPLILAIIVSWLVALAEYCFQVPANRIGFQTYSLAQLKIMQEVITICVFIVFSLVYMKANLNLNFLWAGLCMVGAVYFVFKS